MAGTYTYTFLAKDLMSSKLARIGSQGRSAFGTVKEPHQRFNRDLDRTSAKLARTSSGMGSLIGLAGRLGLAFSFTQAVGGAIRLGAEFEQTKTAFETMLGSAEKGNVFIDKLFDFANRSPFDFRSAQQAAETLLGFGVANEKVLPAMRMIGDVSRGNKERFKLMTLAYAQMQSAGKLMGQDLLQMINAGFNPLQYIAEETGESIASLRKKMEQGAISTAMVERAFMRATGEGGKFFNLMEKQSKTVSGKWQIFLGKLQIQTSKTMEKVMPYFGRLLDWGLRMVEYLPAVVTATGNFFRAIKDSWIVGVLANNIGLVVAGLVAWKTASFALAMGLKIQSLWTTLLTIKQWSLNAALAANPVGFVIIGIMALAAAFTYAYNQIGWFRGLVDASWTSLKGMAIGIKDYVITRLQELMAGFSTLGQALMHFFNGEWKMAWETGKKAADALNPFTGKAKDNFVKNAQDTAIASARAFGKGMAQAEKNKKKGFLASLLEGTGLEKLVNPSSPSSTTDGATGDGGGTGLGDAVTNGINAINGGGSRQTNITVTFEKLVENFTISSQNITQGMAQSEEELKRMLLRVLNSANQMQTSPV